MTPADELPAAAEKLRTARFAGAITATPTVAALLATRSPLAVLLDAVADKPDDPGVQEGAARRIGCVSSTCPTTAALAVARAVLGSRDRQEQP
ncbi:hypothetical protein [Streptomyces sp. SID4982]|uniref:hypothetical protein n=1 Tax=Streptomyces sp. SID4982 TaxID=2690291 RepID=UPI00136F4E43|nr:hypothetical protein [Streptomyces sp. SID4982]MYS14995.1 hypothetical protein [Streptomyces sp. SID4982]